MRIRRAILPAMLALGMAGAALTGVTAAAATHVSAMHYHAHVTAMHYHAHMHYHA
jgi:hypothetical protein